MPTFSPRPVPQPDPAPRPGPPRRRSRAACLLPAILAIAGTATSQTLAHPGLQGNGLNTDPWWQHAIFYDIPGPISPTDATHSLARNVDFKAITARLDGLRSLGVDALLLPAPRFPAQPASAADPKLDELDELIHQASRRGMRVLLVLPSNTPDLTSTSRFWLSRGVAGFHVTTAPGAAPQDSEVIIQFLRRLTSSLVGQRIVISDFDPGPTISVVSAEPAAPAPRRAPGKGATDTAGAQLQIDTRLSLLPTLEAGNLRRLLTQALAQPNLLLDFHPPAAAAGSPDPYPALAKAVAAVLLATHPAALIGADEHLVLKPDTPASPELASPVPPASAARPAIASTAAHAAGPAPPEPSAPNPLLDWYRQLTTLHHDNAAIRSGSAAMLNFDQQNALVWVVRPPTNSPLTPPIVVACNLTSASVELPLGTALATLNLHGSYLRTLIRSDKAMGPQDINAVSLPPFSVYIGELRR